MIDMRHSRNLALRRLTASGLALVGAAVLLASCSNSDAAKQEHFENGKRFAAEGKHEEAIIDIRNALQQDPRFGQARFNLAEDIRGDR